MGILGEDVPAHRKAMGHSTHRDALGDEDSGGPKEPCIKRGTDPPRGTGDFWGCPPH